MAKIHSLTLMHVPSPEYRHCGFCSPANPMPNPNPRIVCEITVCKTTAYPFTLQYTLHLCIVTIVVFL
jgi:hypothetical protein